MADAAVSRELVQQQLERVLSSPGFSNSERLQSFLRYVVDETLSGRSASLKEYSIALEVFDRDESFDPQNSTVVRVEAGRLRQRLERYYLADGRQDPVRIEIPKGGYVARFSAAEAGDGQAGAAGGQGGSLTDVPTGPSIAVLPFDNMSADPEQEYFADGIAEEIINDLTKFPDLKVIARNTTFQFKGRSVDVRAIGRDLGVRYVLEGSVRRALDRVRVTAQLIECETATHLFSQTYDRELTAANLFEVQDDISDQVVSAVAQPFGAISKSAGRRTVRKSQESLDVYDHILRFYSYWLIGSPEQHLSLRNDFERLVDAEPRAASARAALAFLYLDEFRLGFNSVTDPHPLDRALTHARSAVDLDPDNSMAYQALFSAHFHRGEIEEFRLAGERAVSLNPNHADMLADYGMYLAFVGEWERGVALTRKATALSPVHPGWFHCAALHDYYRRRDYRAALSEAHQAKMPLFFYTYMHYAMIYGQLGQAEEAEKATEQLLELYPAFPQEARDVIGMWNMPPDHIEHCLDGLRKAGLQVPSGTP